VELIGSLFGDWHGGDSPHQWGDTSLEPAVGVVERDIEQANLVLGGRGLTRDDPRRFVDAALNHIVGGGMSSRLFQKIREERGLAYSIYSFGFRFADAGAWGVYVGTMPKQAKTALELIGDELEAVVREGVTDDELQRAKGSLKGSLAISLEDANSRMNRLGRAEVSGTEHLSTEERIARIEAVTAAEVQDLATELFEGPKVLAGVGPFSGSNLELLVA